MAACSYLSVIVAAFVRSLQSARATIGARSIEVVQISRSHRSEKTFQGLSDLVNLRSTVIFRNNSFIVIIITLSSFLLYLALVQDHTIVLINDGIGWNEIGISLLAIVFVCAGVDVARINRWG